MKGSKWCMKCLKAPLKALTGFCNLYIKGMNGCAECMQYQMGAIGYPTIYKFNSRSSNFKNSSRWSSSSVEDLRELIRANSVGNHDKMRRSGVGRSQSAVVGRIDEDEEVEFGRDDEVGVRSDLLFPIRSRSLAIWSSNRRLITAFGGVVRGKFGVHDMHTDNMGFHYAF